MSEDMQIISLGGMGEKLSGVLKHDTPFQEWIKCSEM